MTRRSVTISAATYEWICAHISAEELTAWGADCVRAFARLIDNLDKDTP